MAENDDTPASSDDTVVGEPVPAPEPATAPAAEPSPRLTERVWSFRAMVAVALASLVIGGGIGSAIAAVTTDDSEHRMRMTRFSDGPGRGPGMMPGERGRGNLNGPVPGMPDGDLREFRQEFREGLDPEELKELRKEMREEMREQMQEWREEIEERRNGSDGDTADPTPSPSAS